MSNLTVGFKSECEIRGRFIQPAFQRVGLWEAIKRHVDLNRGEVLRIKTQPVLGREIFGVKKADPSWIAPSRRPDMIDQFY